MTDQAWQAEDAQEVKLDPKAPEEQKPAEAVKSTKPKVDKMVRETKVRK